MEFNPPLSEFVGQSDLINRIRTMVETCRTRKIHFPHALLVGPEGSGRTTIAHGIARELGVNLQIAVAEEIERAADLATILNNLEEHDILLIRRSNRLKQVVSRRLLPALRDFEFHIVVGEGLGARTMKLIVNPFTCFATVTNEGECDTEMRRTFPVILKIQPYSYHDALLVTERLASQYGISLTAETLALIARASKRPGEAANTVMRLAKLGSSLSDKDARELLSLVGISENQADLSDVSADFAKITPTDFERLVTEMLRQMGFEAQMTKASGDGGIDIEAVLDRPIIGGKYLIQCKRFDDGNPVGSAAIREFYGALRADHNAVKGIFITTSTFTPQARQFAQGLPIELIGGEQLRNLLADPRSF
jgi:Holliday junction resolvasome RuvABC ATP-dependent DNA helicase subunit